MTLHPKPWPFPNRHLFLQFIYNPLTCLKAFSSMRTRHSHKKRRFSDCDKTSPMMNDNSLKLKPLCGLFGNSFQLVLGHFMMRVIIDSFDFASIFDWSDHSPEINNCARAGHVAPRL